ncbi:uromodulin-like 1 [Melanotaenia boesemani]|uniref:uromodulin-like 1 n=1 Tax=Melanotaenia boesemani TaxID=1250792 RepID=UPI001C04A73C|nr:uromodulin-like 1 [Melanotaenia boesemani]
MSWMFSIWVAGALLALCGGQNSMREEDSLSSLGYHLCTHNETKAVSFLVVQMVPYTVTKPCGGWLLWMTCTVTLHKMMHQTEYKTVKKQVTRCCDGYVQVGRYCALSVNRSGEFAAKPGSCPTGDGLYPRSVDCELDIDCPGWQKCCQRSSHALCSDPASSANYSENGGSQWNATVTTKTDYQQLISRDQGLLNLTRLLQAMVTGALQNEVSIYYLNSWSVHPYRTATSLLIKCNFTLSLYNVTSKLQLLLKHIPEVSSVTVQDVDECAHPALGQCSLQADCNNTMGSYQCVCHPGYFHVDSSNFGVSCAANIGVSNTTQIPPTHLPLMNATFSPTFAGIFTSSETYTTTALSNTSSVTYNLSQALLGTSSAPHTSMSSAAQSPPPTTTCPPPVISSLWSANITGTSISVFWSSRFQTNQTFTVTVSKASELVYLWETRQTMMEMNGLQPGELYNVTVTACTCGRQKLTLHMLVKTDAQTLDATARLTNIQFTTDLMNTSSQAYKNLTESLIEEIYQSLSPEMKNMVDSGQMRIKIKSFSSGSVVANFTIIVSQSQGISNVSTAVVHSLLNSSKYTVDENNTSVNDINECNSGENDCSQWARCINSWASYTCICLDGYIDNNPQRPGRTCQANRTLDMMPSPPVAIFSTVSTIPVSQIVTNTSIATLTVTRDVVSTPVSTFALASTTPTRTTTPPISMTTISTISISATTTNSTAPAATTTSPTTTTIPPSTVTAAQTTSTNPGSISAPTITSASTTATAAPTTTISTSAITTVRLTTAGLAIPSTVSTITSTTTTPTLVALRSATNASVPQALSVQCRVAAITVTVAKDFLQRSSIQESALYLGKRECGVNGGNATHVQLTVAWDECDTRLVHNETCYTASVTLFNTMDQYTSPNGTVEVPRILLQVPIMCTYKKSMLISADFGSLGYDAIKDIFAGLGSFQVAVQLMNSTVPLHHNYSLSASQALVVEVSLNSTSEKMKVVIDKCWVTPTPNPLDTFSYTFLENSCSLNKYTKVLMNGNTTTSRVSVQIFSLVGLNVIYTHCQVQICVQVGSDTCVPDCLQRTARTSNTVGRAFGSTGPILRSDEEDLKEKFDTLHIVGLSCLGVGLSLFFIFGFVCIFYYQRNRVGHYNFNVKPKQENFTYLVFNT